MDLLKPVLSRSILGIECRAIWLFHLCPEQISDHLYCWDLTGSRGPVEHWQTKQWTIKSKSHPEDEDKVWCAKIYFCRAIAHLSSALRVIYGSVISYFLRFHYMIDLKGGLKAIHTLRDRLFYHCGCTSTQLCHLFNPLQPHLWLPPLLKRSPSFCLPARMAIFNKCPHRHTHTHT